MPRHFDAQEKILMEFIVCSSVLTVPGFFRPSEYFFGDYSSVPRHVDAHEKILTEIIV